MSPQRHLSLDAYSLISVLAEVLQCGHSPCLQVPLLHSATDARSVNTNQECLGCLQVNTP